jgi:phage shock protein A
VITQAINHHCDAKLGRTLHDVQGNGSILSSPFSASQHLPLDSLVPKLNFVEQQVDNMKQTLNSVQSQIGSMKATTQQTHAELISMRATREYIYSDLSATKDSVNACLTETSLIKRICHDTEEKVITVGKTCDEVKFKMGILQQTIADDRIAADQNMINERAHVKARVDDVHLFVQQQFAATDKKIVDLKVKIEKIDKAQASLPQILNSGYAFLNHPIANATNIVTDVEHSLPSPLTSTFTSKNGQESMISNQNIKSFPSIGQTNFSNSTASVVSSSVILSVNASSVSVNNEANNQSSVSTPIAPPTSD